MDERKRKKGKFVSVKTLTNTLKNVTNLKKECHAGSDTNLDHSYAASEGQMEDPEEETDPEQAEEPEKLQIQWKSGRRVVSLAILASQLEEGCARCHKVLHLIDTQSETRQGLGSYLYVRCRDCSHTTPISTDSKHTRQGSTAKKVLDVNTKAALGMVYAGLGAASINKFLAALNIPQVRHRMLKRREREIGCEIEDLAKESCHDAAQKELSLSTPASADDTDSGHIAASFDGGWQKRGSGHSYDSLSGHASMIGKETGKIISYDVRCKDCRSCSSAKSKTQKSHDCRKNFSGSAKSMEADMCVSMLKDLKSDGIEVKQLIMDNDSTSIARARNEVNASIVKCQDTNHLKKSCTSKLYELAKRHKQLTPTLISYITRCVMYAIKQNNNNATEISNNLRAIVPHLFGEHDQCSDVWCGYKQNPDTYTPKHLPYRRYLADTSLKTALTCLIEDYGKQANNLTSLGSSQRNEAFNKSVASKNPKAIHYSASESTCFRVAAAVAQTNTGNSFTTEVNDRLDLSPGIFTLSLSAELEKARKRRSEKEKSTDHKRQRLAKKNKVKQEGAAKEIREGTTYKSNVCLETHDADWIEAIPPPVSAPSCQTLPAEDYEEVFFDLETTGLGLSHIVQLAAFRADGTSYSRYVQPKQPMTLEATKVSGIAVQQGKVFLHGQEVPACSVQKCLEEFGDWLSKCEKPVVLIAHNAIFDATVLINACLNVNMFEAISAKVAGFLDTLKVTKHFYPNRTNYKQSSLVSDTLNSVYNAHNAVEDCKSLCQLYQHTQTVYKFHTEQILQFSITMSYVREKVIYDKQSKSNITSLQGMIDTHVITKVMAGKIAGSGLCRRSLQLAHSRDSQNGIKNLFQENAGAKCRVTKSNKIAQNCAKYFSQRLC